MVDDFCCFETAYAQDEAGNFNNFQINNSRCLVESMRNDESERFQFCKNFLTQTFLFLLPPLAV